MSPIVAPVQGSFFHELSSNPLPRCSAPAPSTLWVGLMELRAPSPLLLVEFRAYWTPRGEFLILSVTVPAGANANQNRTCCLS